MLRSGHAAAGLCTERDQLELWGSQAHHDFYVGYETPLKSILHDCSTQKYNPQAASVATGSLQVNMQSSHHTP